MSNFARFLIYSRTTCIITLICLFVPKWRGYALQLLFADFILNLLCFGMTELKGINTYPPDPTNPLLPAHALYMYQKSLMVSLGTGYAVWAVLMGFTMLGVLDLLIGMCSRGKNRGYILFGIVVIFWVFLALFAAALPIPALAELIVKTTNLFRTKDAQKRVANRPARTSENHWTSWLSSELAQVFSRDNTDNDALVHPNWFSPWVWLLTFVLLAAATVSAVVNWMTTVELYEMAGDAWRPEEMEKFTALQVGLPLLGHALDTAFMAIS
ncbi:hypothetical protein G7Y89_g7865 [Cudoniella acicularis]|uniref:Uncharacterized protein n=1 Tax=Cudoniella acicularis TaxID=354080 RepID=A0A8H4RJP7_9HELO|nr:hypothetical protein G7Y89_g7865 [Cudoniella acicularis]